MVDPAVTPDAVARAVEAAHRDEWGVVLAATILTARDLDLAEECVQEAYVAALTSWTRDGIPDRPAAWLTTTARRRALDALRRRSRLGPRLPLLVVDASDDGGAGCPPEVWLVDEDLPDERLRLVFLCCHPALAQEAQLALTLRLVCGVATADVARALLVSVPTMAARLTRAKRKIAIAHIPMRVPRAAELPDRLRAVLGVVHLLFSIGHAAPTGPALVRPELADEAIRLARAMRALLPDEREVVGLLALLVLTDARRATRVDGAGALVRLEDQDRGRWDRDAIDEARPLLEASLRGAVPGRYGLQAAVAALHAEAPSFAATDWPAIVARYDQLLAVWPSPVVALNRAVARSMVTGPEGALADVEALELDGRLASYHYLPAVKADLLRRLGRDQEADEADRLALSLAGNDVERAYLRNRLGA